MRRHIARHNDMRAAARRVVPDFNVFAHRVFAIEDIGRVGFDGVIVHGRTLRGRITPKGELHMIAFAAKGTGEPHQ